MVEWNRYVGMDSAQRTLSKIKTVVFSSNHASFKVTSLVSVLLWLFQKSSDSSCACDDCILSLFNSIVLTFSFDLSDITNLSIIIIIDWNERIFRSKYWFLMLRYADRKVLDQSIKWNILRYFLKKNITNFIQILMLRWSVLLSEYIVRG
jgi:hypothetical protein